MRLVTGVIPVHNHARWVADAVTSFTAQDHPDKRLVVVDDGSTDGSFDAVVGLMAVDKAGEEFSFGRTNGVPTIVVRHARPGGPALARNVGMRVGWDTDYFALLDSDDYYHPGKVSRSVALLEEYDHLGICYSDYDTLSPDGVLVREYKPPYSRQHLLRECIINCDSVVKKAVVEKVGLLNESLRVCEDYDWWLRLTEHCVAVHVPESLVTIRVGYHGSTSSVPRGEWERCHRAAMEGVRQRGVF